MDHSEVKHLPKVDHTPAELDDVSRRLLKAAALLEKVGHTKVGSGRGPNGSLCMLCSITDSGGFGDEYERAKWRVRAAIGDSISDWNNAPERTPAEVVAKLRAVALGG